MGTLLRDAGFDIEKKDGQWVVHVGDETITIVERRPGEQIGDFDPHDVAGFLRACGYEVVRSRSKLIVTVGDRHP